MQVIQTNTHSFIVKVWREESNRQDAPMLWRGQITHVPSGQRYAFTDLYEIPTVIEPYLIQLGVKLTRFAQIKQWWRGWRGPRQIKQP